MKTIKSKRCGLLAVALITSGFITNTQAATISLPSYNADIHQTSVSGVSSGAMMAVQMDVIHSSIMQGIGLVAGGPYDCPNGDLAKALTTCMNGSPNYMNSVTLTDSRASSGLLDPTTNLARQKVFLVRGYNDGIVHVGVMNSLYSYYTHYTNPSNVMYKNNGNSGHTVPTDGYGNACSYTGSPFFGNCGNDWAGNMLQHIYGRLNARNDGALSGQFIQFSQAEFISGLPASIGMDNTGFAYVPAACASGTVCKVHVSFHGCLQYAGTLGNVYYTKTGINKWADTNNMIVLYPQTVATVVPTNPNGCWDWAGNVSGPNYANRYGPQIMAVRAMIDRLTAHYVNPGAGTGTFGAPANVTLSDKTNVMTSLNWKPVFGASKYKVYRAASSAGPFNLLGATTTAVASYADTSLSPSTTYYYRVTAIDGMGTESAPSSVTSVTTAAAPPFCDPWYSDNVTHSSYGRAYVLYGLTYALGSNNRMGLWSTTVSTALRKSGSSYYVGVCP
jgi:poly(3-hydroxybutyrate) depolymerase